jgi:hypothetical protein
MPSSLRKLPYKHDRQGHRHNRLRDGRCLRSRRDRVSREPLGVLLVRISRPSAPQGRRGWLVAYGTLGQLSLDGARG